jgi:hypothetical protein
VLSYLLKAERPSTQSPHTHPRLSGQLSSLKNAHFAPTLHQCTNPGCRLALCTTEVLRVEKLVLPPECKEVREERVEVRLGAQVENLSKMCVIEMREDAEQLSVDVLDG